MQTIGEGKGSLTVTYTPQPKLPGMGQEGASNDAPRATAQQRLATSPEED